MADDDWRIRIELAEQRAPGLFDRLSRTDAEQLARGLRAERLAVTHDEDSVFLYGSSQAQLVRIFPTVEAELRELELEPRKIVLEHWLDDEDRWDSEPKEGTVEEEMAAAGFAPWEVRVECRSHTEARELADRLEAEGYTVVRRWAFVIVGTATREEAEELAARVHGEVEPGGELVYETAPGNPFAFFGGLAG
jgi:hypothetical protein